MKRFVAAAAAAVLTLAAAPLAQAAEHNPGDPGHGVELGKIDHPCAGRKLLYHSHNDALYGTYKNDKLTVMAVDGQQVTDQEKVCFRLAPDADADGNDVSTLTVPEDGSLDFLGEPGSTVWAAPQSADWTDSWRPIWSGLGAFDPAHEAGEIPDNFVDDVMHFDLVEMDGPGDVNVFFSSRVGDPERLFSSADEDMRTITYEVGGHGHFTWTFSEPGIYEMTWQGRAELDGGGTERSEPVTQYWLVGDDATVGLPEGTTTDLRTPNTTEETTAASPTTSTKSSPKPTSTAAPTPTSTTPAAPADRRKLITSGHMDMALVAEGSSIGAKLIDDSDPHHQAKRESGSFIFAVPNAARKTLPEGARESFPDAPEAMWILPQAQEKNLPWLGFSTTRVAADALAQGSNVTVSMRDVSGPGRIYTWHEDLRGLRVELDSGDASKQLEYPVNAHDHQGFGFTEPGAYTATFTFSGTSVSGEDFSEDLVATFAVGDEAVTAAREGRLGGADAAASAGKGKLTLPGALAEGIRSLEKELKKAGDTLAPLARKRDTGSGSKSGSPSGSTAALAAPPKQPQSAAAQPAPAQPQRASSNNRASASSDKQSTRRAIRSKTREDSKAAKPAVTTKAKAPSEASSATTGSAGTSETYAPSRNPAGGSGTGIHSSLDAAGAQPDGQAADTSPTAGGFWAGLAIGVGVMALIGGCVLFVAAARLLRKVERSTS
ncbi:choice-of-anchor M domain-containing protein [Corynebacterium sp. MSK008]|uniref:choice-of-anchor M domain-containing protein n=1 Tax=Corynebacterium sp. MSK008 TaxID=3050188 RepID=UPI00254F4E0B|nr:choice-of-anchor M domain-containing protein [Corynebacterium sp. MSK008]MDK8879391.1 choice-of-anchor M domain-containing protein [Corynebacterium sp. MSK008]